MKITFLALFLIISFDLYSQNSENYRELFPNEDAVTISLSRHISVIEKKGKLNIIEEVEKTNYYITDNQLSLAKESISYNTFNSIKKIEARTIDPSNKNNNYNKVNAFIDKDVIINGIFFNDQKKKSFTYPNVTKGVQTHLKYSKQINDPHFLPAYIIGQDIPIQSGKFSISFPNSVEVAYKTYNLDSENTNFEIINAENKTTYKWTLKSIPKINRHYDLSPLYYIPQIIVYIKSYVHDGVKKNILSNPNDLYEWYTQLISNINKTEHTDLKTITSELIKDVSNTEEKIKRIYYFVQDKINYIAFEDGLNGFIPRDAINVYLKKYGDCKDMANILNEMLHYANIPSYLTWIGTRKKPYSYYDVPTPIADNHMITVVKVDNEYKFLDATAKYLTYGYPSPFIQGKEALLGIDNDNFEIVKVPEVEAEMNKLHITSIFTIDDENLSFDGTHKAELSGYNKLEFLHKLERKEKNDFSFLNSNLKFGTKKTIFENINYQNLYIEHPNLFITFNTSTPRYFKQIDKKLYIKPNLDFNLKSELVKNEAKAFDKNIEYKCYKNFITSILIPNNYTIDKLPESSEFNHEMYDYSITYKLSEDKKMIEIEKLIHIKTLIILSKNIDDWNNFIKALNKIAKHNIILKKT